MKTIVHWTVQYKWNDGEYEYLEDFQIPDSSSIEAVLDQLEEEANNEEEE